MHAGDGIFPPQAICGGAVLLVSRVIKRIFAMRRLLPPRYGVGNAGGRAIPRYTKQPQSVAVLSQVLPAAVSSPLVTKAPNRDGRRSSGHGWVRIT